MKGRVQSTVDKLGHKFLKTLKIFMSRVWKRVELFKIPSQTTLDKIKMNNQKNLIMTLRMFKDHKCLIS